MRARLIPAWPALSQAFGIHPWDLGRLSGPELDSYLEALQEREWNG